MQEKTIFYLLAHLQVMILSEIVELIAENSYLLQNQADP